ncbi:replication initiation and membrane attachment family protein [Alkalihalobacterium chitinilyticum]|uniref:DnaD domain protein n=1 Tax=Alkalihalobacterium chitinilyticum TaxID=2980103 RepID=A0ABT5VA52_9BACI|nr:DnaD domain protein [Alkalihalobacterium chitinilyticum]MDE5412346.1 DnaD domain protein [Alkalihalobacterium chitinilyticum]
MEWHWKELLPVDRLMIRAKDQLTVQDQRVLILLYQPLIGAVAYSLYMTLWSELEDDIYWSEETTHRQLMISMDLPLPQLFQERKKLEAIGLLKTYKKKKDDYSTYLYELQPPMSPQAFFTNDVLSVYLYNRLGKTKYRQIRERFLIDKLDEEGYEEVTYAFDEVFTSLSHSEIATHHQTELIEALEIDPNKEVVQRGQEQDLLFADRSFDFQLLESDLATFSNAKKLLTVEIKKVIIRLAFVYRIEPLEMSRLIQQALLHDDELNVEELRKRAQEWYKIEYGNEPPTLGLKTHPLEHREMSGKVPQTEEEKMISLYETTSPLDLLESRSDGAKVPLADVKIIESLLLDYQLMPGVVNVLIDSILIRNDMKLTKALIDKIAGHWSRKNIKTVKEAMELARLEYQKNTAYQQSKNEAPVAKGRPKKSSVRKEKLPKWLLKEQEEKSAAATSDHNSQDPKVAQEKERFNKMMEQLKQNRSLKEED